MASEPPRVRIGSERARLIDAIARLPEARRLRDAMRLANGFELEIVQCDDPRVASALVRWLGDAIRADRGGGEILHLSPGAQDRTAALDEAALAERVLEPLASPQPSTVAVFLDATWSRHDEHPAWHWLFRRLNERRNAIAEHTPCPLVLLLPTALARSLPAEAPDVWSVRSVTTTVKVEAVGGHELAMLAPTPSAVPRGATPARVSDDELRALDEAREEAETGSVAAQQHYVQRLRQHLHGLLDRENADALRAQIEDELLPAAELLGDERELALALGLLADAHERRGDLDEALRIRRDEELPVYERLGDPHARAVTMGQIADVLQTRGDLDEALRIRRDEELPLYRQAGDLLARTITMGKIADILHDRGELDEALRIYREQALPVFEQLGDVRGRAVTMGRIANILRERGDLDESLRIHREEELPVYDRLGEERSRAITMGKIADILRARGDLDEALRIRREVQLPVYDRLGDVRARAVTMGKIAEIHKAQGNLEESLRIEREQVLPVQERLGGRDLVVVLANLASTLIARAQPQDLVEARRHLERAHSMARAMRIPFPESLDKWLASDAGRARS